MSSKERSLSEWDFDIPLDNKFREWPLQQIRAAAAPKEQSAGQQESVQEDSGQ